MKTKKALYPGKGTVYFKKEVSELLSYIRACDTSCGDCGRYFERLYDLLQKLSGCEDALPSKTIEAANGLLDETSKLSPDSSYKAVAQKLIPVLRKQIAPESFR